jgi:TRAP-type C4-dicarboxylate transport system substrate-binding protein
MKSYKIFAVVATIAMFCNSATFAQSTEIRFLKGVNPRYPTNNYYKAFSSTAKPVTITIPFCMLAIIDQ